MIDRIWQAFHLLHLFLLVFLMNRRVITELNPHAVGARAAELVANLVEVSHARTRGVPVILAWRNYGKFVLLLYYSAFLSCLDPLLHLIVSLVSQVIFHILGLVVLYHRFSVDAERILRLGKSLELLYECIDFLSFPTHLPFSIFSFLLQFMELFLQFRYFSVLVLNLRLFLTQNALHTLVLVFECDNRLTSALIIIYKLTKLLISVFGILLHLALYQEAFVFKVRNALLYKLLSRI